MAVKRVFTTTKRVNGSASVYRKWAEWDIGDILIGKYVGSKVDRYKKMNWHLEVYEAQFVNDEDLAEEIKGKIIGLNSAGKLNKAMEQVEEGEIVQITFNGSMEMKGGDFAGKDAYLMDVDIVQEEGDAPEEEEEVEDDDDL